MTPADDVGFELPPRSVFEPPSYPNIWFYVEERLADGQPAAVALVTGWLREEAGLVEDFGRFKAPEAADGQARLAQLQPWQGAPDPALDHAHDLHIRYYHVALRQRHADRAWISERDGDRRLYYRFAASVHYEVEDEHPRHPSVDECPWCGRTGEYAGASDLFAGVHEPLGLELLLYGTVRGHAVSRADGRPATGLVALRAPYRVEVHELRPTRPDMNVAAIAVVTLAPPFGGAP
ncbi:MAG: hypothetical protein HYV62_06550 [Candidatus Rokubacteria bacterium]|nr:hypothetical protein [Candidatus Rokubacteria bacterium]